MFQGRQKNVASLALPFSQHKSILFVDNDELLGQFVSVLTLSEPKWVGVDIEHSKSVSYHGLICLIQVSWPVMIKRQVKY